MPNPITTLFARIALSHAVRRDRRLRRRAVDIMRDMAARHTLGGFTEALDEPNVGLLSYDLGRIRVRVADGVFHTEWEGREHHAVPRRSHETRERRFFVTNLRDLTERHFLGMRRPDAGPHHMAI